jgi:Ca2+-binding EF-hand superfamily protein
MRVTDGRSFFKAMDKDTSGSLDVAEVARGLKRLGLDVSAPW